MAASPSSSVGVSAARAAFSELLERAGRGETISITKRGKEIARLTPPPSPPPVEPPVEPRRKGGWMKGQIWYAPDWEETPQDIIDLMEGKDEEW